MSITLEPETPERKFPMYHFHASTDVGLQRSENQDRYLAEGLAGELGLFVVADGAGGYKGGALAAQTTVDAFLETLKEVVGESDTGRRYLEARDDSADSDLERYVLSKKQAAHVVLEGSRRARRDVLALQASDKELANASSTVVVACLYEIPEEERVKRGPSVGVAYAWLGDSRAYKHDCIKSKLEQLTSDHDGATYSLLKKGIDPRESRENERMAKDHAAQGKLTACVNMEMPDLFADDPILEGEGYVHHTTLGSNESLLLTCDGSTDKTYNGELERICNRNTYGGATQTGDLREINKEILHLANQLRGGHDNITTIAVTADYIGDDNERRKRERRKWEKIRLRELREYALLSEEVVDKAAGQIGRLQRDVGKLTQAKEELQGNSDQAAKFSREWKEACEQRDEQIRKGNEAIANLNTTNAALTAQIAEGQRQYTRRGRWLGATTAGFVLTGLVALASTAGNLYQAHRLNQARALAAQGLTAESCESAHPCPKEQIPATYCDADVAGAIEPLQRRVTELNGQVSDLESSNAALRKAAPTEVDCSVPSLDELTTRADVLAWSEQACSATMETHTMASVAIRNYTAAHQRIPVAVLAGEINCGEARVRYQEVVSGPLSAELAQNGDGAALMKGDFDRQAKENLAVVCPEE